MIEESRPMRLAVGEALVEYGRENPEVVALDADTSSSTQTKLFAQAFPERFFNVGISEANLVSVAAGLSLTGKIPFAASFAFLLAYRAGDQVRSQIAYGKLNVKLIGSYCGLSDYADGASHQGVTDLSVMRALPHMTVVCPADLTEAQQVVKAAAEHPGPVYIRVSRAECRRLFDPAGHPFRIGRGIELRRGGDVGIVATGTMLEAALEAAGRLEREGVRPTLLELPTLKPLDRELLLECARRTGAIVTCEENTVHGGLFGAVAEVLALEYPVPVAPVGIHDRFSQTGSYPELLEEYGLTAGHIVRAARSLLE